MFKYISDNELIPAGRPFTDRDGIKRPSNWLERALPWELEAAGIKKYDDLEPIDYRFASGYDSDGNPIWRPVEQVKPAFENETRAKANTLLHPTDWMVIREADNGTALAPSVKAWRESIRVACGVKLKAINKFSTTDQIAAYATSVDYLTWPEP
jgi:hypothetical protein